MPTHVPLDQLVVHLLALTQAASELPTATLERLAALAPTVEATVPSLRTLPVRLQIALSADWPAQTGPASAWHSCRYWRRLTSYEPP